jgi:hypothetical protein
MERWPFMKKRSLLSLFFTTILITSLPGTFCGEEDLDAQIAKASKTVFDPAEPKGDIVDSLIEFLDITLSLTASSKYKDEIKHHIDVAKDLFKNSSIFNDKARQYVALAYRMVTEGEKYQKPSELDEFITPAEAQEKATKYAKQLVEDARANVKQGNEGKAAKLILELVLMVITPLSG